MKTREEIEVELESLVQVNYYSEANDLKWAVKSYEESLEIGERDLLRKLSVHRLEQDPSIVNVVLVSCWDLPESIPALCEMLDQEATSSQLTRSIMSVLQVYSDGRAYRAVERFLDSEQEGEALTVLARMDFQRALPALKRALRKKHLMDTCLHVLHERRKLVGFDELVSEISVQVVGESKYFHDRLRKVLSAKSGDYNPFTSQEINRILGDTAA